MEESEKEKKWKKVTDIIEEYTMKYYKVISVIPNKSYGNVKIWKFKENPVSL